jgi:putative sporulation protein YyaC
VDRLELDDQAMLRSLAGALRDEFRALDGGRREVVIACIGTDRSTGDALGPLVGDALLRLGMPPTMIIGTLRDPLHALNLDRVLGVAETIPAPLVVAVDAALGPADQIGAIRVRRGGLRPGEAVGKTLPSVGDLSVTAIVNCSGAKFDARVLQSTRLFVVHELSRLVAAGLWWSLGEVRREAAVVRARQEVAFAGA